MPPGECCCACAGLRGGDGASVGRASDLSPSTDFQGMHAIEKKHLKKMSCPKCQRPKLRFEHTDGAVVVEVSAGQRKLRCDVCKIQFLAGDAAIQASLDVVLADATPAPIALHR